MGKVDRMSRDKRKWLSVAKKYYHSCGFNKLYESFAEFLKKDSFAKILKHTKTPLRKPEWDNVDIKHDNRKERHDKNKIIDECLTNE